MLGTCFSSQRTEDIFVLYWFPSVDRGYRHGRKLNHATMHAWVYNAAIAAVALLERSLARIGDGARSIFPSHSQAWFGEAKDQEPLSVGSLHPTFHIFGGYKLKDMDKSPLCKLASENSARTV